MDRFAVIGLGRFGTRFATRLSEAGAEVIAIDLERRTVEEFRDQVTLAIALDATDEHTLRVHGVDQVSCAIVGIGHNFEANALITVLLKSSLRVKQVISRAANTMQARILSRIGADSVVVPEEESADRWVHRLLMPLMLEHNPVGGGYALAQISVPPNWQGKTLAELDLRRRHKVTVVAIKRRVEASSPSGADTFAERVVDAPMASSRLEPDDVVVLAGFDEDLQGLPR